MDASTDATGPGFFGKVPALGDFLTWRLPSELAAEWDAWLGEMTTLVRQAAGPAWPDAWLTAPLWHFTLGAGVLASYPAAGVLVASADRVGRMFPFTVIGPSGGEPEPDWTAEVEASVLDALDDGFTPAALQARLTALGPPRAAEPVAEGHTLWWCRSAGGGTDRRSLWGLPRGSEAVSLMLPE